MQPRVCRLSSCSCTELSCTELSSTDVECTELSSTDVECTDESCTGVVRFVDRMDHVGVVVHAAGCCRCRGYR